MTGPSLRLTVSMYVAFSLWGVNACAMHSLGGDVNIRCPSLWVCSNKLNIRAAVCAATALRASLYAHLRKPELDVNCNTEYRMSASIITTATSDPRAACTCSCNEAKRWAVGDHEDMGEAM